MHSDPLFKDIEEALGRHLDAALFQRCANALLKEIYPTLAPLRGGSDAGMDGAIADDPSGRTYPLICTTSPDVLENFRKSIQSHLTAGGLPRAVIATSALLTPPARRKIHAEAAKLGVQVRQIHDRAWFADALYWEPKWRIELLGIPGDPPPFSRLAFRSRHQGDGPLIGRDEDLDWIKKSTSDVVLVGVPGSGKTFLLEQLARAGECLFVIESDRGKLADGLRKQRPTRLVVDDAHLEKHLDLIRHLRHLRQELGADLRIVAVTWPTDAAGVADALGGEVPTRSLELLSRDDVVKVIHAAGLAGPDLLTELILDQAEGRPGLATMLARLCLNQGVHRVWTGDALFNAIERQGLVRTMRERTALAAFALGGEAGMDAGAVETHMGISRDDLRELLAGLAPPGVINPLPKERLQVRPDALRYALVRHVFFGPLPPPITGLIAAAPSKADIARVLMAVHQRGAAVDPEILFRLATEAASPRVWKHLGHLSAPVSRRLIAHHPDHVGEAGAGLLATVPEEALPALMSLAGRSGPTQGQADDPLRVIDQWIDDEALDGSETIQRRELVLGALQRATGPHWNDKVGDALMGAVMSPGFTLIRANPGSGHKFTTTRGVLRREDLTSLAAIWPRVLELLKITQIRRTNRLQEAVWSWCYPGTLLGNQLPEETKAFMRATARRMIEEIAQLPSSGPGRKSWAHRLAKYARLDVEIPVDPVFELLHGERDLDVDWRTEDARSARAMEELAAEWALRPPSEVAALLQDYQLESTALDGGVRLGKGPQLCQVLAGLVSSPIDGARAFIGAGADHNLVHQFLRAAVSRGQGGLDVLAECLGDPRYRDVAADLVIGLEEPPGPLLEDALQAIANDTEHLDHRLAWMPIPESTMRRLLEHPDAKVRAAAALAEWERHPTGAIREGLRTEWRRAALECDHDAAHWCEQWFKADQSLAHDWIEHRIGTRRSCMWEDNHTAMTAVRALGREQRSSLLGRFTVDNYDDGLVELLLGDDVGLYEALLKDKARVEIHLRPLGREVSPLWERQAVAALAAGYGPEQIAAAAVPVYGHICECSVEFCRERLARYQALANHQDARLRPAGRAGIAWAQRELDMELKAEQRERVYGTRFGPA